MGHKHSELLAMDPGWDDNPSGSGPWKRGSLCIWRLYCVYGDYIRKKFQAEKVA